MNASRALVVAGATVALLALACRHTVTPKADDPKWYAEVHAGKSLDAVRDTIDELLERNEHWTRGPHGFEYQDGDQRDTVACGRLLPGTFRVRCDEELSECAVRFERKDLVVGQEVLFDGYSHDEAQLLYAMMLRFCGWRED